MSISLEKSRTKQIGAALLAWILSAAILVTSAALLIDRLTLDSKWIGIAAAAVIFLSAFSASLVLFRGEKSTQRWMKALLLWLVISSTLLMFGFLSDGNSMSLRGLIRILACSLLGSLAGMVIGRPEKKKTGKRRFMPANRLT